MSRPNPPCLTQRTAPEAHLATIMPRMAQIEEMLTLFRSLTPDQKASFKIELERLVAESKGQSHAS